MFIIFQIVKLEGWVYLLNVLMKTHSAYSSSSSFFLVIVTLGAFVLIQLMLAIIKVKYSESSERMQQQ